MQYLLFLLPICIPSDLCLKLCPYPLFPHLLWGSSEPGVVSGLGGMLNPWMLIAVGVLSCNVYVTLPQDNLVAKEHAQMSLKWSSER